jgi:hypothetical protein
MVVFPYWLIFLALVLAARHPQTPARHLSLHARCFSHRLGFCLLAARYIFIRCGLARSKAALAEAQLLSRHPACDDERFLDRHEDGTAGG